MKLFKVEVESFVYVLAEDQKAAEKFVLDATMYSGDISAPEVMEGASAFATEVTPQCLIDSNWWESLPYISSQNKNAIHDDYKLGLTCGEIIEKMREEAEEEKRKREEEERFDKVQMKLDFSGKDATKESEGLICRTCGYTGAIETFEPSMSVYSDCRCPKCGSTNNEHNSNYLRDISAAMNDLKDKADNICKKT